MEHPKKFSPGTSAIVFLLFAGFLYICVWSPSNPLLPFVQPSGSPKDFTPVEFAVKDELDLALEKASMRNKTVIIAVVNRAYVEQSVNAETTMLDLFLESFWLGEDTRPLLDHLLLVAVDKTAYDRCMFKRLHCYRLVTEGVDFGEEKVFMSRDFIKMMWRRTFLLMEVLRRGYSFILQAKRMDVVWGETAGVDGQLWVLCPILFLMQGFEAYVGVLLLKTAFFWVVPEWQIIFCGILLVVMAVGNFINTVQTLVAKSRFKAKMKKTKGKQEL